ncbi:MAG TPA: UDP-N-acetylmuramate dehydrogenase [Candidatus Saccharimonadales bacterium]|nr:UDP-N-acetylmuramate dehydrogenase [Candidatus Saccharimonadales bacterium]
MPLQIKQAVDLTPLNTLGISATADYLARATAPSDITEAAAFAHSHDLPLIPLGSGSNIVIGTATLHCVLLKIEISGRSVTATPTHTDVRVGAGERWDELVAWSVEQQLHGIEALSLIPGTVGAAPVQNVGAYGQEISQALLAVEAYDLTTDKVVTLSNAECRFAYRDSIFKHAGKQRYIITAVTLRLTPATTLPLPTYATLQAELERRGVTQPTVADIRSAVIAVRQSRLPDPAVTPTVGSFFHNPVIAAADFAKLQADHPEVPHWSTPAGQIKLAAAWLVEQTGLKGEIRDGVGLYEKQAICLINPGHKPAAEVLAFRDHVIDAVEQRFGIRLQMEPELIAV